ncbi:MAG: DUF1353 domain-containing protein [Gemmatimonadota bacterium]
MTERAGSDVAGASIEPAAPQAPPPPLPTDVPGRVTSPAQMLSADFRSFRLLEAARYTWWNPLGAPEPERDVLRLDVPESFTHDFASVPRVLWMLISPLDLGLASIFHDWLYRKGGQVTTLRWDRADGRWDPVEKPWSRRQTDELFARMMREQGVPKWRRRAAYLAVRFAGGSSWRG